MGRLVYVQKGAEGLAGFDFLLGISSWSPVPRLFTLREIRAGQTYLDSLLHLDGFDLLLDHEYPVPVSIKVVARVENRVEVSDFRLQFDELLFPQPCAHHLKNLRSNDLHREPDDFILLVGK